MHIEQAERWRWTAFDIVHSSPRVTSFSSSHDTGIDTAMPLRARTENAATVLEREAVDTRNVSSDAGDGDSSPPSLERRSV